MHTQQSLRQMESISPMKRKLPSRKRIMELLSYDEKTGLLTWKHRDDARPGWNNRYAGTIAGNTNGKTNYVSIDNGFYPVSAICWLIYAGEPVPELIDHVDGNNFNNVPNNLRDAESVSNNNANRKRNKNNTTGVKGVSAVTRKGKVKYEATVGFQGERINLGRYDTVEEAAKVRQETFQKLFGDFARHE
jgi:hypothetical protein